MIGVNWGQILTEEMSKHTSAHKEVDGSSLIQSKLICLEMYCICPVTISRINMVNNAMLKVWKGTIDKFH